MNSPGKRSIIWVIQIAVTVGAMVFIFRSVDLRTVLSLLWSADLTHLLIALAVALAHFAAGAWRWQQLIHLTNKRHVAWKYLFESYLTSFFISSILPGTVTGDFVRIYDTRREADGSARAASIVFTERLLGLVILIILGVLAWAGLDQRPKIEINLPSWLLPVMGLITIFVLVIIWFGRHNNDILNELQQWFRLLLTSTMNIPGLMLQKPSGFLRVMAGTLGYQLLALLIVFEALLAAHVPISLGIFIAVAPLVTLLIMMPLSIQGVGLRESLYISLLVPFGALPEAVLTGLSLTYLIGLPFILWGWLLYSQRAKQAVLNV